MTFKPGSFSEKQLDVMLNPDETINALVGSVRSGKTIASLFSLVFLLPKYPHGNILLIGKTDKTLYRNIIKPLQEIFGENEVRFSRGTGEGVIFGHPFFATGANDEKAITKIQGLTLSLAYGDEVTTWPENFFNMLISRLSDADAKLICTMNPEGPYHWFKVNFLDRENELSLKSWLFLLDENLNLPKKYVENLKKFYTGLFYRRYVEGAWVLAEGAIYDMFDESKHVKPVTQDIWKNITQKYISIDYGTTNKCVFQLWGIYFGKRYLKKEYCYDSKEAGRQKTDSQYANDLVDFIGAEEINQIIIDPSAASFKAELNFRNLSVFEADNEVLDGIRMVATELGLEKIQIDPSCTNCIHEFTSYVWDIKASEQGLDKPLKTNDHSCFVAGTLIRTDHGDIPIEDIKIGDKVLTRLGFKEVIESGVTSEKAEVLTYIFKNGETLTATRQHPIFVKGKGYIPIDSIRYGDKVYQHQKTKEFQTLMKLNSTELFLEDTQAQKEIPIKDIIPQTQPKLKKVLENYTKKSGSSITEKYPKTAISTTKTEIILTTLLKISNVLTNMNILENMPEKQMKIQNYLNGEGNIVVKSESLQKNGTLQKKVENGTLNTVNKYISSEHQLKKYVNNAEKNLIQLPKDHQIDSVLITVNRHGEEHQGLMMKRGYANNAEKNIEQINMAKQLHVLEFVQVKDEMRLEKVYNIQVKDAHEYFANGILVHNCDAIRYFCKSVPIEDYSTTEYRGDEGYTIASSNGVYSGDGYY